MDDRIVLLAQYPEGGSPWHPLGDVAELDQMWDELAAPRDLVSGGRLPAGTAVRATRRGAPIWAGVVLDDGRAVRARKLPVGGVPGMVSSWDEAWDGDMAEGPWMMRQCGLVRRELVATAAVACARSSLRVAEGAHALADEALAATERWARGEGDDAAALAELARETVRARSRAVGDAAAQATEAAGYAASIAAEDDVAAAAERSLQYAARAVAYATSGATFGDLVGPAVGARRIDRGQQADDQLERRAAFGAAVAAERCRQAGVVRAAVPLGVLLLSKVRRPRAVARDVW